MSSSTCPPATGVRMKIRDESNCLVSEFECFPETPDESLFQTADTVPDATTYAYTGKTDAQVAFPSLNNTGPYAKLTSALVQAKAKSEEYFSRK